MALLAVAASARAEAPLSDDDRFALYCMGALQSATRTIQRLYPAACPTGRERGCMAMRESIAAIEEGRERTLAYLSKRVDERRGITGQLPLTLQIGEQEQKRCLRWRLENLDIPEAGPEPRYCQRTERCKDLSHLL